MTALKYVIIFVLIHFERQPMRLLQVQRMKKLGGNSQKIKVLSAKAALQNNTDASSRDTFNVSQRKRIRKLWSFPSRAQVISAWHMSQPAGPAHRPQSKCPYSLTALISRHLLRQLSVLFPILSRILCCCHFWKIGI